MSGAHRAQEQSGLPREVRLQQANQETRQAKIDTATVSTGSSP
jgi:hypothetical protein